MSIAIVSPLAEGTLGSASPSKDWVDCRVKVDDDLSSEVLVEVLVLDDDAGCGSNEFFKVVLE
jgi:hypothetical protein